MKKLGWGLVLVAVVIVLGINGWWLHQETKTEKQPINTGLDTNMSPRPENRGEIIKLGEKEYEFNWFEVNDINQLSLESNLEALIPSQEFLQSRGCKQLINGGFYDTQNQHLGWVVVEGQEVSKEIESQLFNGFLMVENSGEIQIAEANSQASVKMGIQSGPILIKDQELRKLVINNDKPRRRSVAAVAQGKLLFMVIREVNSDLTGPYLTDMPEVMKLIGEKISRPISAAINLDGGTASVYYDGKSYLQEVNPIGSYFCVKKTGGE